MKITEAQLAKGYEQAKAVLEQSQRCLCGSALVGQWTAGVHHGEHRCARVITRLDTPQTKKRV